MPGICCLYLVEFAVYLTGEYDIGVTPHMKWDVSDSDWAEAEKKQTSSSKKALLLSFAQSSLSFGPTLFKFAVEDKNNPSSCKENNRRMNSGHKTILQLNKENTKGLSPLL